MRVCYKMLVVCTPGQVNRLKAWGYRMKILKRRNVKNLTAESGVCRGSDISILRGDMVNAVIQVYQI